MDCSLPKERIKRHTPKLPLKKLGKNGQSLCVFIWSRGILAYLNIFIKCTNFVRIRQVFVQNWLEFPSFCWNQRPCKFVEVFMLWKTVVCSKRHCIHITTSQFLKKRRKRFFKRRSWFYRRRCFFYIRRREVKSCGRGKYFVRRFMCKNGHGLEFKRRFVLKLSRL